MLPGFATPCRVVYEVVRSQVLIGNRLGDPTERVTPVILPPSYEREPERRYPVIYLLAALTGTGWQLLSRSPLSEALDERLWRLYQGDPSLPEFIVVLPDCFTALGGSQYVNSPALGRYQDHLTQEVIPQIDRRYRTLATAQHRGVVGRSSGGIGALWLAMNHPELFGAVASHAGDGFFRATMPPELLKFCRLVRRYGGPAEAIAGWFADVPVMLATVAAIISIHRRAFRPRVLRSVKRGLHRSRAELDKIVIRIAVFGHSHAAFPIGFAIRAPISSAAAVAASMPTFLKGGLSAVAASSSAKIVKCRSGRAWFQMRATRIILAAVKLTTHGHPLDSCTADKVL